MATINQLKYHSRSCGLGQIKQSAAPCSQPCPCAIFPVMHSHATLASISQYYKEINLGNVSIKTISHMSRVKECDYRSVALASIRSFAVVHAVLTYVY